MPPYKCGWIVATPDACAGCKLNPKNAPEQSLRLAFILRLEAMQAAGAVFYIDDLKPEDWRDLLTVKSERNRRQYEELNKKG